MLLAGANSKVKDHNGRSVWFSLASGEKGNCRIGIKILLKFGADLLKNDNNGMSPVQFALERRNFDFLKGLIDEKVGDWNEYAPLILQSGETDLIDYLNNTFKKSENKVFERKSEKNILQSFQKKKSLPSSATSTEIQNLKLKLEETKKVKLLANR